MEPIYLDYNATTPIDPRVVDAMIPWLRQGAGNPSSGHAWGRQARAAVETARGRIADLLGCDADEVVLTSGGSESDNYALKGTAWARRDKGRHLVVSAVEHPAVLEPAAWLQSEGWRVTTVPVDGHGVATTEAVAGAVTDETVVVSVMHANNETGVIQPLRAIADAIRGSGAWLHADCAQSVGKIPVRVRELGLDLATLAGHKVYAPKGIGALYVRRGIELENLVHGAGHEAGRRAGTEAVAQVVALGEACRVAGEDLEAEAARLAGLRDLLARLLSEVFPDAVVHGADAARLPNTLSIGFPGLSAPEILDGVGQRLAASAGAACHGSGGTVSGVLAAMGVEAHVARGTIRLSVGRFTTENEVTRAVEILRPALAATD